MTQANPVLAQTEAQFSDAIVELARLLGWLVHRDPTFRATAADPGYPDLTLLHPKKEAFIMAELKLDGKPLSTAQLQWREAAIRAGIRHFVWRPADWPLIEYLLKEAP